MTVVLPFLLPYVKMLLAALIVGLFLVAGILLPFGIKFLISLTDKIVSEKVRVRVQDAVNKLNMVVSNLISGCSELYRKEILIAIKDGRLDNDEIKAISKKLAEEAIKIISPELATFKRYLTGEAVFDYVVSVVNSMLVKWANDLIKQNPTLSPKPS